MAIEKSIYKYLQLYAEPISNIAKEINQLDYTHALVIPVYDEYQNSLNLLINLNSLKLNGKLLITLVINDNELSSDGTKQHNKCLYDFLLSKNIIIQNPNFSLISYSDNIDVAIFYLCENNHIQSKQGVGLARKIGCDFILQICQNKDSNIKWIHSTDADVILPDDYFKQIPEKLETTISAYVYDFEHYVPNNDNKIIDAINIYENSLRVYVNGLASAGSSYSYHTIGSLLAVSPLSYAQVRGFPKLNAAEDFYLLNKLAKVAPIKTLQGEKIKLQARLSKRAPFGTGPALSRIIERDENFISSLNYQIELFEKLKIIINFINHLPIANPEIFLSETYPDIHHTLETIGFYQALRKIERNTKNKLQLPKHMHDWFD
ncbi:MAG: hypothetical protein ACJA0H_001869, partial [Francisellaceae bacterium]